SPRISRRERPTLYGEYVEQPIAVVVQQSDPAAHRFGRRRALARVAVVVDETEAARCGVVAEFQDRARLKGEGGGGLLFWLAHQVVNCRAERLGRSEGKTSAVCVWYEWLSARATLCE